MRPQKTEKWKAKDWIFLEEVVRRGHKYTEGTLEIREPEYFSIIGIKGEKNFRKEV